MNRIASLLLIASLAAPASATPASATPDGLQGTWLGWSQTSIALGLMVPVIEEMRVEGDRVTQTGWRLPYDFVERGCFVPIIPGEQPGCAFPVPLGEGRIKPLADGLRIEPVGPQENPHNHPIDAAHWPDAALVGHDWQLGGDDRRRVLSRPYRFDGEDLTLERVYYRAPIGTAGWLYHHLVNARLSLGRAVCGIEALHGDPEAWAGFLAHLEAVEPVATEVHRLTLLTPQVRSGTLRRAALLGDPGLPPGLATDVSDLPEAARTAFRTYFAWLRDGQPVPEGQAVLQTLAWPVPSALAEIEAACIVRRFNW